MNKRTLIVILLTLILVPVARVTAQETDSEVYDRALPQFKKLLDSETEAKGALDLLLRYSHDKKRSFPMLVKLTQKSLVAGVPKSFVLQAISDCGLIADAQGANDSEYALIVLTIFDMRLRNISAYSGLESLTQLGVPAYRLVGLAIGKDNRTVKNMAMQDKLNVAVVAEALLSMFQVKYGDDAKK
jgi:hypothetical protein